MSPNATVITESQWVHWNYADWTNDWQLKGGESFDIFLNELSRSFDPDCILYEVLRHVLELRDEERVS
jgi:hypothetical protein